jgi:hypothetical protein
MKIENGTIITEVQEDLAYFLDRKKQELAQIENQLAFTEERKVLILNQLEQILLKMQETENAEQ